VSCVVGAIRLSRPAKHALKNMHQLKIVLVGGAVVMALLGILVVSTVADYLSHPQVANVSLPPVPGAGPAAQPIGSPLPTMLPLPAPGTAPTPYPGQPGTSGSGRTPLDQLIQQLLQRRRSRRPG